MSFLIFIHIIVCALLVTVILMQSGRGGGLTEGFASAESMLGAQTNVFMSRLTSVLSVVFLVTCLSLAVMSSKKDKSLMANVKAEAVATEEAPEAAADVTEETSQPSAQ